MQQALEVENLIKRYGGITALNGVSLSVRRGEIFGFLGPNGAGKSTLVKILLNLVRATAGSARIFGEPVTSAQARLSVGYLPENMHAYPFLTIREFLHLHGELLGLSGSKLRDGIDAALAAVELAGVRGQKIGTLSKGMLQRAGIAQALLGQPELLVLDEPTSGLDPIGFTELRRLLLELRARGTTIFLNSHLLSEVERTCDRVAILHRGKIIKSGSQQDLSDRGRRLEIAAEGFTGEMADAVNAISARPAEIDGKIVRAYLADERDAVAVHRIIVEGGGRVQSLAWKSESLEELFYRLVKHEDMGADETRP